ncbi:hypothetical protein PsAD2_01090 [Pseudovibrio axinellae]|uniref:DUF1203 domain-containing protein n=1 Tax=Pseudovibrio axinellae TaxID=989403 RepID=A0A166A437_9HYPH|nr:DUF1203 domain-containing protein [Pseudovibrio axinellae]KZL20604.1 hypothetical protein PsAD2_01090 [Pseudovibrio axinellae]SER28097.1 Protein of unknown function [Pseudovibrio axinellae]
MAFVISGLKSKEFEYLNGLSEGELSARNVVAYTADAKPGFPCRVTLADAEIGERVFLVNYVYQPNETPYKASHAVFVRENATQAAPYDNDVPVSLSLRLLSLRGFDANHMMIEADIAQSDDIKPMLEQFFENPEVSYIQMHYARRGCFAAVAHRRDA